MTRFLSAPRIAALALLAHLGVCTAAAQFDTVTIDSTDLGGGIHLLTGRGGNMVLAVGQDGALLVDDQYAPLSEKIIAEIASITDVPVRFVVNTHWHGDHTGGNEAFGGAGSVVVAHDNVRVRMGTEQISELLSRITPPSSPSALPIVTFSDAVTFHFNGQRVEVLHVEHAHTDGDAFVRFPDADVLHVGDVFFNGTYPFIDASSGGSVDGTFVAVDLALEMAGPDTRIVPGHGPLADREALQAYRDMLATTRAAVAARFEAGKSLEETIAEQPNAAYDAAWGGGFIDAATYVQILYADLASR